MDAGRIKLKVSKGRDPWHAKVSATSVSRMLSHVDDVKRYTPRLL